MGLTRLRVLLTGASSFTGAWFAMTLAGDGHQVVGTLQHRMEDYPELERRRIAMLQEAGVTLVEQASYGNAVMQDLVRQGFDRLCFHASDVRDYRSADFDLGRALQANLTGMREASLAAKAAGTGRMIWTGTVFEPHEARGDRLDEAITPYGLSKWLSWQALAYYAAEAGLPLGKFIVPNPFGPLEQLRFCTYLVKYWARNERPEVRTPDYIRDNIPVDRLARAYADFVALDPADAAATRCGPSGYAESQGQFTARFARELGPRLGIATPFTLARQTDFAEPMTRIGLGSAEPAWDETRFWDALAADYARRVIPAAK
ncbi:NAD(P)-dependent oxidoreductase [Novosphingobium sp.]|uniref:NAD-dependent epimerase/dehydratase family protein n=2 Tax=Novosphingobium sp. TaxID=1874826 RepID=UPI00286A795E|nr:NAD(P)-dependent oxidoreductase [Novosphingobium sp.]